MLNHAETPIEIKLPLILASLICDFLSKELDISSIYASDKQTEAFWLVTNNGTDTIVTNETFLKNKPSKSIWN